jgi:hypothetical protein
MSDDQAARDFAAFLAGHLGGTGASAGTSPAQASPTADNAGEENDPAADFAAFISRQLYGEPDTTSDPSSADFDRDATIAAAIARHNLGNQEAIELLNQAPDEKIETAAARLAAIYADAPRRPRPDMAQGKPPAYNYGRDPLEGLGDAIRAAVGRADGRGAYRDI